uniref:CD74 molecule, major histocompatibility complex, class II invariant chain a n=1 Tax=Periophthalmus magnuspinnatus TaxID=409849 RepID=A0A3B4AZI5_9GOBI
KMEHASEDAPLAADSRAGSEQVLVMPSSPTRGSNSHALKVAGITALVCLLVSAQVFTAYLVFDQKQQIQGLQANNQKMERQMTLRSRGTPQKIMMPADSLPLLDFSSDEMTPQNTPKSESPKDHELPEMNESFLANLQTLKQRVSETDWKSFESWMRYWLIFQMAQKPPTHESLSKLLHLKEYCMSKSVKMKYLYFFLHF